MARLSGVQRGPVISDALTCPSLLVILEGLTHSTVSGGWSLGAESVPDADDFVRRLIEDGAGEVIGFGLTVSDGTHLHLTLLHARDDLLLMSSHVYTALSSFILVYHMGVQISPRVVTAVSRCGPGLVTGPSALYVTTASNDHLLLFLLVHESHF